MTLNLTLAALLAASLALTACAEKQDSTSITAENSTATEKISPEQQAAIDSIDPPILDEKNTDVAAELANLPADEATAVAEVPASNAVAP